MSKKNYTTPEAAKLVGISRQTLQAWVKSESFEPPQLIEVGNVAVRLWTDADIKRAKQFKGTLRRGPEPRRKGRR
jgi:DNA-binding transcriptional MerR regulator